MTRLFHQLGYRYQWNIQSYTQSNCGDGFIIGPRYMPYDITTSLPDNLKVNSIFDPQFYLPSSNKNNLQSYPFFPNVLAQGFSTVEWNSELRMQSAVECIRFQIESGFQYIVIPSRYQSGMPSDYIETQMELFVEPFREALISSGSSKPCLLQLILTDHMLRDVTYRTELLNWVTGLTEIDGVYLIYHVHPRRKQIEDVDLLFSIMHFVNALKRANMFVAVGYANTESIPLLACKPDIITIGSYENLRMFGLGAFQDDKGPPNGPNARIYISNLLQWVDHQYIGAIQRSVEDPDSFFDDSEHRLTMFRPSYRWYFTKSEPYKHYFIAFERQVQRLLTSGQNLFDAVYSECQSAMEHFDRLERNGLVFEPNSSGRHIPFWLTALNMYRSNLRE